MQLKNPSTCFFFLLLANDMNFGIFYCPLAARRPHQWGDLSQKTIEPYQRATNSQSKGLSNSSRSHRQIRKPKGIVF